MYRFDESNLTDWVRIGFFFKSLPNQHKWGVVNRNEDADGSSCSHLKQLFSSKYRYQWKSGRG